MSTSRARFRWEWAVCFAAGAAASVVCLAVAGVSLNLFLGSLLVSAILAPTLCDDARKTLALVAGFSLVWFWVISIGAWADCTLVLVSFAASMVCAVRFLRRFGIHPVGAAGIVTFSSLMWLSWPIWFAGAGPVMVHPLFAINAACKELGIWTEQRVAYGLTSLGQDTPYRLPGNVWPAVVFHAGLAVLIGLGSRLPLLPLNAHRLSIHKKNGS